MDITDIRTIREIEMPVAWDKKRDAISVAITTYHITDNYLYQVTVFI